MALYLIYGWAIPVIILAALFGFRWKVGMWGNCVSLGVVLFSILIAIGWWEDVAHLLASNVPQMVYIADCIAIWAIFLVSLLVLDMATRSMSTVKVKYNDTVEQVGNGIALFLLCLALIGFADIANGHLGAVGENHDVTASSGLTTGPAISAFRILSAGNLSGFTKTSPFNAKGDFLDLHLKRRQALMLNMISNESPIQGMWGPDTLDSGVQRRE